MEFFLMWEDEIVTVCDMTEDGRMISWSRNFKSPELAPLEQRISENHILKWWENRRVPIGQGHVKAMLVRKGLADTHDYLLKNLGLSMTDHYWMKPVDSDLKWENVNLFENDFRQETLIPGEDESGSGFSPNSSLKGELEKSWVVKNGERVLIKGNHGDSSMESINEVIATSFHRTQKYRNHTSYKLIRIKGKPYKYGCCSKAFTGIDKEFVSAYAVITSERKPAGSSKFEHLINVAGEHGIDKDEFRHDLEYQILSDYLLSNTDRHMENLGVLRDAKTKRFLKMAPIFDTGRAFSSGSVTPYTEEEIENIEVNSFNTKERELLDLVRDYSALDMRRLMEPERIEHLYKKDPVISQSSIDNIIRLYKRKQELLKEYIEGRSQAR